MGNPTLGEVKTMMIGVRNNAGEIKSVEVWVNELRLLDHNSKGGWAANGNLNVQLSDREASTPQVNIRARDSAVWRTEWQADPPTPTVRTASPPTSSSESSSPTRPR